jgi:S-adenosylmethionine:tRNA ribosyltransferase-isomerase
MWLSDFDFPFDPSLIADRPLEPRDQARLLVVRRDQDAFRHACVADLPELLDPGDVLVVNDTKVMAARFIGRKRPGGGRVDLVVARGQGAGLYEVLLKGKVRIGQTLEFSEGITAIVTERSDSATLVQFNTSLPLGELGSRIGRMPLPPYIKREPGEEDRVWYQTLFARQEGAIAAPTAGLHFTDRLVASLERRGVSRTAITLHVGPGTFLPVTAPRIEEHRLLPEWVRVPDATVAAIEHAKKRGRRVVAVGTTVVRALESAANGEGKLGALEGETSLFVTPGYRFRVVDAMLTNFHLPRSTLLMLVAGMVGVDRLRAAYAEAVQARYRFYSYGDAMLIL